MRYWIEELALVQAAAVRIQGLELAAQRQFDVAFEAAEAAGHHGAAMGTPQFASWQSARRDTDAAWSRWAEVVKARPAD